MSELIEKLKNNERAFGLLNQEEQNCFVRVGKSNCEYFYELEWEKPISDIHFSSEYTYRIKHDYQPETEPVDIEILESPHPDSVYGELGIYITKGGPWDNTKYNYFTTIEKLVHMPNFRGFYIDGFFNTRIDIQDIAELISKGQKVVARFVK